MGRYAAKTAARLEVVRRARHRRPERQAASAAARECGTKSRGTAIDVRDPAHDAAADCSAAPAQHVLSTSSGPFFASRSLSVRA